MNFSIKNIIFLIRSLESKNSRPRNYSNYTFQKIIWQDEIRQVEVTNYYISVSEGKKLFQKNIKYFFLTINVFLQ